MVVVCALLEHEIIMMIPAVVEPVVEFKLLKKCLRYNGYTGAACAPRLGKITITVQHVPLPLLRSIMLNPGKMEVLPVLPLTMPLQ